MRRTFRSPCYSTSVAANSETVTSDSDWQPELRHTRLFLSQHEGRRGRQEAVHDGTGYIYQPATPRGGSAPSRLSGPPFTLST